MKATCSICTRTIQQGEEGGRSTWCALCTSIVDKATDHRWLHSLDPAAVVWAYDTMPDGPSSERWRRLEGLPWVEERGAWARLTAPDLDPVVSWGAGEAAFNEAAAQVLAGEGVDRDDRRALTAGVVLATGHVMQFTDQGVIIDGVGPLDGAPWKDLLQVLTSPLRIGWDLAALTVALTAAAGDAAVGGTHRPNRWTRNHIERPVHPLLGWVHAHARIGTPMDATSRAWILEESARHRVHRERGEFHDAVARRPLKCLEGWTEPWLFAWWGGAPDGALHVKNANPLRLRNGRLRLCVPTSRQSSLVRIPANPLHWAWLTETVLLPPWADDAHRLHALCAAWRLPQPLDEVDAPLQRSIVLLNGVLDDNADRTAIEGSRVLVRGRLGHGYSIMVGHGAHGAPFVINGLDGQGRILHAPICIFEDRQGPERPLGDVLGTVVLSLLDDVGTSRTIRSLATHMTSTSPAQDGLPASVNDLTLGLPWCDAEPTRQAMDMLRPMWQGQEGTRDGPAILPQEEFEAAWREGRRTERGRGGWLQGMVRHGRGDAGIFHRFLNEERRANIGDEQWGNARALFGQQMEIGPQLERDMAEDLHRRFGARRNRPQDPFEAIRRHMHVEHRERWEEHDPREGARRWRDLYARVWTEVGGASEDPQPIHLVGHPPYDVTLQSGLRFTVRDEREDGWLRFLLDVSGWVEQEDGMWHRVGGWAPDAATQLVLRLNAIQREVVDTDARPWWWEYIRDGARRHEPAWRLEEDLRDEG
jgi:hypothetical protein